MSKKPSYRYKGIAFFGAPGSGKTTMAKLLIKVFPGAQYLEAADSVIYPSLAFKENLPEKEADFFTKVARIGSRTSEGIIREDARNFAQELIRRYSKEIIAKTLAYISAKKYPDKLMLLSGIRGYKNAVYLKDQNYLIIYLKTAGEHSIARVSKRESSSIKAAQREREVEERLFQTSKIEGIADLSLDTHHEKEEDLILKIKNEIELRDCRRCVNSSLNMSIGKSGLCSICEKYEANFNKADLRSESDLLLSFKSKGRKNYDVMVGISGGKDSSAALYEIKRMGFKPLAFSLNTGYYPEHIFKRAREVSKKLKVDYIEIDARKYIRPVDRICFRKTAELYDQEGSVQAKQQFRKWYLEGRKHYSIKCRHALPFVRTCQLCRRIIIRAYYGEALKYGVSAIILGINEWAGLSQSPTSGKFKFSAIRKLKPFKNKPAVHVIHLPFLLQRKIKDTNKILAKLGWEIPKGESLIESNSNSCLFARAAENTARKLLGFHPDTTRLARETTVGFISKDQALQALNKIHNSKLSVRQVLGKAKII